VPYWVVQFGGAICAALFLQAMSALRLPAQPRGAAGPGA
jgi:glycerol uptake facilitator-like aquaporin